MWALFALHGVNHQSLCQATQALLGMAVSGWEPECFEIKVNSSRTDEYTFTYQRCFVFFKGRAIHYSQQHPGALPNLLLLLMALVNGQ